MAKPLGLVAWVLPLSAASFVAALATSDPADLPYFVHEEEVPRVGTRLSLAFHRARWYDGRPAIWLGTRRATGRGEASSGLAFDQAVPASPA